MKMFSTHIAFIMSTLYHQACRLFSQQIQLQLWGSYQMVQVGILKVGWNLLGICMKLAISNSKEATGQVQDSLIMLMF